MMGEAKRRGTYEERKALADGRAAERERLQAAQRRQRQLERIIATEKTRDAIVESPRRDQYRRRTGLAITALSIAAAMAMTEKYRG